MVPMSEQGLVRIRGVDAFPADDYSTPVSILRGRSLDVRSI